MHLRGGRESLLEWYEPDGMPVVTMTPALKLGIGSSFSFGARWALMQYHCWADRRNFLDMTDAEVRAFFLEWIRQADCPWYVLAQYLTENGVRRRGGAGPSERAARRPATKQTDDAREDIEGWEWPCAEETSEEAREPWSETEKSSDEGLQQHDREDTHVLSLLYKGNVAERNRQEHREKKAAHQWASTIFKNTRCTTIG